MDDVVPAYLTKPISRINLLEQLHHLRLIKDREPSLLANNEGLISIVTLMVLRMQQKIDQIKAHLAKQFNLPAEQIEKLMPSFIATLQTHMQNLEKAVAADNPQVIGEVGHTIKGAFLNLGLDDCAATALHIEQRGKAGDRSANYKQLFEKLHDSLLPVTE